MDQEALSAAADLFLEEHAPVKKDKSTLISDLVEQGRTKGKLTAQEIMDPQGHPPVL